MNVAKYCDPTPISESKNYPERSECIEVEDRSKVLKFNTLKTEELHYISGDRLTLTSKPWSQGAGRRLSWSLPRQGPRSLPRQGPRSPRSVKGWSLTEIHRRYPCTHRQSAHGWSPRRDNHLPVSPPVSGLARQFGSIPQDPWINVDYIRADPALPQRLTGEGIPGIGTGSHPKDSREQLFKMISILQWLRVNFFFKDEPKL